MKLAIHGGEPVRKKLFPGNHVIGAEEKAAVARVMDSEILSGFYGSWDEKFYGGPEVRALEKEWAGYFGVKHAVSVNSATSGLYCAMAASGCGAGDEVIVSPYTMCASATAPLIFNAIPVFADIEEDFYCLDVSSVKARLTPRTKAIVVVDIFGLPFDAEPLGALAKENGLIVIEDAAQAPGAVYRNKYAGTLGDIGVFSLNYHKHIHCGEGGVVVTNNDELAERVRLVRNHAEAVVGPKGKANLVNMLGFNFRMNEMEAAIARCQLKKLAGLLEGRRKNCAYLSREISKIPCLKAPLTREASEHSYYLHAMKFDESKAGIPRQKFVEAVVKELAPMELRESDGPPFWGGYLRPLYNLPLYQKRIAYGTKGCPWTCGHYEGQVQYSEGICPVAERMYAREVIVHEYMLPQMTTEDMDDFIRALFKVWELRAEVG